MPELDYAFLADYAVVTGGKLTVVGASFTHIAKPSFPAAHVLAVAGRIRAPEDLPAVAVTITLKAPEDTFELGIEASLAKDEAATPYRGKVGILFAASFQMPLPVPGLYEVNLLIEGQHARRLAFEVVSPEALR